MIPVRPTSRYENTASASRGMNSAIASASRPPASIAILMCCSASRAHSGLDAIGPLLIPVMVGQGVICFGSEGSGSVWKATHPRAPSLMHVNLGCTDSTGRYPLTATSYLQESDII